MTNPQPPSRVPGTVVDRYAVAFRRAAARRSRRRALVRGGLLTAVTGAVVAVFVLAGGAPDREREITRPPERPASAVIDALGGAAQPVELSASQRAKLRDTTRDAPPLEYDAAVALKPPPVRVAPGAARRLAPWPAGDWTVVPRRGGFLASFDRHPAIAFSNAAFAAGRARDYFLEGIVRIDGLVPDEFVTVSAGYGQCCAPRRSLDVEYFAIDHEPIVRNAYRLAIQRPIDGPIVIVLTRADGSEVRQPL